MEFFQIIMIVCSTAADKPACENYFWKCLYEEKKLFEQCVKESPYKLEKQSCLLGEKEYDEVRKAGIYQPYADQ